MALQGTQVESFPFDSQADGYDVDGYPVYDRAVGARVLRSVFEKFFSDGVFPNPGDALQINKGTGLNVTVQPGIFIIKGAMGGIPAGSDPLQIKLSDSASQGSIAYGIMLRYDENADARTLSIRAVAGTASSTPQPPAPDRSTPGVYEYRLGYVSVPNGATDLSGATVTNEKGTSVCPYAAPFEEIDVSGLVHDFQLEAEAVIDDLRRQSGQSLANVQQFIADNMEFVQSAIDGTTAGNLQNQINELEQSTINEDALDSRYFQFAASSPDLPNVLTLVKNSIGHDELKNGCIEADNMTVGAVTPEVLGPYIDVEGGISSFAQSVALARDISILHFDSALGSLTSDQKQDLVIVWDFPSDASQTSGDYDSGSLKYYCVIGG